jgi:gas vesicle protein
MKGFALGAALGAIAGILFAPQTGKKSQKVVLAKAHAIKGMVAAKAASLKKFSEAAYAELVEEATMIAKEQKMTQKEIGALKKDLMGRYKDLKKQFGFEEAPAKKPSSRQASVKKTK